MSRALHTRSGLRDLEFTIHIADDGWTHDQIQTALLNDIRTELRELRVAMHGIRGVLGCPNARAVPQVLRRIDRRLSIKMPLGKGKSTP